ncbi:microfibril-associated glycoprotein 4-like [Exaiptasia diaphana]|uniref:Fibrinogen C-terminal domain-containing protein n=1 Tax=Exaiptasia diaphana TaxID=2652724 RepID=A0A913YYI2_EXADI|nr:microfibril-associated glycoprotein 4-like [Exaiptasia diaphana]
MPVLALDPEVKGQKDGVMFGNFIHLKGYRLKGNPLKTKKLLSYFDCLVECIADIRCMSANVNMTADNNGRFDCEHLDFDKYEYGQNLTKVLKVNHYALPNLFNIDLLPIILLLYPSLPSDCAAITSQNKQYSNGIYRIKPSPPPSFYVYCDIVTTNGGWTIIQRRLDGSVDFNRGWADYKRGFGDKNGEYWLGLDRIHAMTSLGKLRLRVDLEDFEGNTRYAEYDSFSVADEANKYRVSIDNYTGNVADSLTNPKNSINGMAFSTKDRDNDRSLYNHCASLYTGGWWFNACHDSNLNGLYLRGKNSQFAKGVVWSDWKGHSYSLKRSEMKIKPKV